VRSRDPAAGMQKWQQVWQEVSSRDPPAGMRKWQQVRQEGAAGTLQQACRTTAKAGGGSSRDPAAGMQNDSRCCRSEQQHPAAGIPK
jgi:hypothetical protein